MNKKNKLDTMHFAQTLIERVEKPSVLSLFNGQRIFHDNTYITFKGKPLGQSLESYHFGKINIHNAAKLLIDNAINPLSKELPEAYDAGVDWLESQIDITNLKENKPYWDKRIKVLRENSPSLKR